MTERCVSCDLTFVKGDGYYPDADGGYVCAPCAGDGPFFNMNTDEPCEEKPEPLIWGGVE